MSNTHSIHVHGLPTDAALQAAIALDDALDRLATPATPSAASRNGQLPDEHAQPLLESAKYLSRLNTAQPDEQFAASLRDSLLKSVTASPPPASSAPVPATLGIQPALPPMYRTQFWPTPRLAAMLVAVACLMGALLGGDNLAHRVMDLADRDPTPSQVNDIPIFRNDPAGAASQPGPAPSGPVSIQWTFRTGAILTGSPVIADGILYVGAFNQRLYAIDAENGTELWSIDAGGTVRDPAVVDGVVYFVTGANDLIAVDAASGFEQWRVSFDTGMVRPPTVVDGTVYLSTGTMGSNHPAVADGTVYTGGGPSTPESSDRSELFAIDATTGAIRWTFPTGDTLAVYAIDAATGQQRWRTAVDSAPWGAPAVADGSVFISTGKNGPVIAMDANNGAFLWQYDASAGYGPVLVDGTLFGANFALDPKTGQELWRNDAALPVTAAPAIVGDTAYLMTAWGTLYALDKVSGAERWHSVVGLQIAYALSPIVTNSLIYVAASDGTVYALGDQSNDPNLAALPRDVPSPDDCSTPPVDPASVVDPVPTEQQPFVWPLGSPADTAKATEVSAAYSEFIACQNTGDPRRSFPLFSESYWQRSAWLGGTMPTAMLSASDEHIPAAQMTAIRSLTDIHLLNDGRIGAVAITEDRSGPEPTLVTKYVIFARSGDGWLIDDAVTIWESSEIPPISLPASNSATSSVMESPTGCTIKPPDLPSLAATVNATRDWSRTPVPTPTQIPIPSGTPASEAVTNAVHATVREYVACANAGDAGRGLALFTTDLVVRLFTDPTVPFEWDPDLEPEPATPRPASTQFTIRSLSDVFILPDGRATVTFDLGVPDSTVNPPPFTFILTDTGDRWLISDLVVPEEGTPTASESIEIQTNLDLRSSAAFAARVADRAAPGSTLRVLGAGEVIDGILWVPVNGLTITGGLGPGQTYYVPAAYLMATGARIPGIPVPSTEETGTPHPSECTVEPIPLAEVATYMGPPHSTGPRSAMALLATIGSESDLIVRTRIVDTLREVIACHNAGSYTQSVALNTQNFYQQAGASAYRPNGTETDLATARPLAEDQRSEILAIGTVHDLDDGRVGVVVIGVNHDDPVQVGSTFFILARSGDRWLIDDAILIDSSATPATVSAGTGVFVEDYFAVETSTPTVATPTEPSSQAVAQPIFPIGGTTNVRGMTINLHSLPRSNAEVIARLGPCACAMEVFGPMADSGDALWLPVTDLATGVSGYVSLDFVLPPERFSRASFRVGQSVVTTTPVRLRGLPEFLTIADDMLPTGTTLEITGDTISSGHFWIRVHDPVDDSEKWIAHDILVAATSPTATAVPTLTPTPAPTPGTALTRAQPDLATGQTVIVTADSVNFRTSPEYDESNVILQLEFGDPLHITGPAMVSNDTTWYPVELLTTGDTGYVVAEFIEADDSIAINTPD